MVNGLHLYSAFIQSAVHLYSAFIQSAVHLSKALYIYIAPLSKALYIYIAPLSKALYIYIAPLSKALYIYIAPLSKALYIYIAPLSQALYIYIAPLSKALYNFDSSHSPFHTHIHTPTAIGCHARHQSARQEQLGVRRLAQGHTQGGIKPATLRLPDDSTYLLSQHCPPSLCLMYSLFG